MKSIILFFLAFLFSVNCSYAQQEYHDTTFGTNGRVSYDVPGHGEFGTLLKHQNSLYGFIYYQGGDMNGNYPIIVKYNSDGAIDTSFNTTGFVVTDLRYSLWTYQQAFHGYLGLTNDNKIIAITSSYGYSEDFQYNFMGKFNLDGSVDTTFGENGYVSSVFEYGLDNIGVEKLENDDVIIVGSETLNAEGMANLVIVKFNSQGDLVTEFGTNGMIRFAYNYNLKGPIQAHFGEDENSLYVSWSNANEGGMALDGSVSKYNLNLSALDSEFGNNGNLIVNVSDEKKEIIHRFTVSDNGEVIVVYKDYFDFSTYEGSFLIKYNDQQVLDTDFGTDGSVLISSDMSVFSKKAYVINNSIYVIGEIGYGNIQFIKRFNLDGSSDLSFGNDGTILGVNLYNGNASTNWIFDMIADENTITTCGTCKSNPGTTSDPCIYRYFIDPDLEVENFNSNNYTVYPNPAENYININHDGPIEKVEIYNTLGQLVKTQKDHNSKIDISALQKGIYHLRIIDAKGKQHSTKIIKNK